MLDKLRSKLVHFGPSMMSVPVKLAPFALKRQVLEQVLSWQFRQALADGELDFLWLWILCGLPFGIHRMCVWIVPGGDSLGGGAALFVLNFVIGGIIGGFVLVWRLLVAAWDVPLTIYRLIVG